MSVETRTPHSVDTTEVSSDIAKIHNVLGKFLGLSERTVVAGYEVTDVVERRDRERRLLSRDTLVRCGVIDIVETDAPVIEHAFRVEDVRSRQSANAIEGLDPQHVTDVVEILDSEGNRRYHDPEIGFTYVTVLHETPPDAYAPSNSLGTAVSAEQPL